LVALVDKGGFDLGFAGGVGAAAAGSGVETGAVLAAAEQGGVGADLLGSPLQTLGVEV